MKGFSSEQLDSLNAQSKTGRFVQAIEFVRDPDDPINGRDYFVRNSRSIVFNNHVYQPLDMKWSGIKVGTGMELPSVQIDVSNLGGQVLHYIEDNDIEIEENDVWLQIFHINKFGTVTLVDKMLFQLETIVADYHTVARFNLGVNYSLNDPIPRDTLEKQEYPGIRDDVIRVGT